MQRDNERGRVAVEPDALYVRVTHLLAADDALDEQFQCGVYAAVCGQLVPLSELPSGECPEGCGCELALYCPECVIRAAESSAEGRSGPGAQEDDGRESYYLGECGHRVPADVEGFGLLTAKKHAIDSGLVASSARAGAKTIMAGGTFAYRAPARPLDPDRTRFELGAYAHGPEAEVLAKEYVELLQRWDRDHRGGPGTRIEVYPTATPDADLPLGQVINKEHTRVVISWP